MSEAEKEEISLSSQVSELEQFWLSGWQAWFAELKKKHDSLLALVHTLHSLDEEFAQAMKAAIGSQDVQQTQNDDRFVRVNFGGRPLTLRRDHLSGPHIKHNLFCVLFDVRWQAVLPKDKEGRIYLDVNYEWIKSLLEEINAKAYASKSGKNSPSLSLQRGRTSLSHLNNSDMLLRLWGLLSPPVLPTPHPHPYSSYWKTHNYAASKQTPSLLQYFNSPEYFGKITIPKLDLSKLSRESALSSFMESIENANKEIETQLKQYNNVLKLKLTEARFIEHLLQHNSWAGFVRTVNDNPAALKPMHEIEHFQEYVDKDADLVHLIRESYLNIAAHASPAAQALKTNNIVTFNVDGESVSVLRSSILSAVPGSQLAIRVSEDWVEQESTMDDEGRLIVEFPKGVFLPLVDYIRAVGLSGVGCISKVLIIEEGDLVEMAIDMLEYFAISNLTVNVTYADAW